jgi:hypothetical protein
MLDFSVINIIECFFRSLVPAFRDVIDVPLVVRGLRKSRSEVCVILLEKDVPQA